jgi:hypothetical protein
MNNFQAHVSVVELADYLEGNLSLLRRMELESHIAACSQCADDLAEFEYLIGLIRKDTVEEAQSSLMERAIRLFQSRASSTSGWSELPSRIRAVLSFDSFRHAPALGVRSGKPTTRQLLYRAGGDEIDLRIEPDEGRAWTVSGQILGEGEVSGKVVLLGPEGACEAILTELSEFVLPSVQAGAYKLILSLADTEVEIEELRIGS